jgi:ATP-dependent DNA helicase RecG
MSIERDAAYLASLINELRRLPAETRWVEFKQNHANPQDIGEYLSALSNAAALAGKANAYLVWGVEDGSHALVGTTFEPETTKKGNEQLESWLLRLLSPRLHFRFLPVVIEGKRMIVLEIPRATGKPTSFEGRELVRIGSVRKPLKDNPEKERELWRLFDQTPFEEGLAVDGLSAERALDLLDYPSYFALLDLPLPGDQAGLLSRLRNDRMLVRNDAGQWAVTNLGGILFARDLSALQSLARKAPRVVIYEGKGRLRALRERVGQKGYAAGFSGLMDFLATVLPRNEVIGKALRRDVPMYPDLAVRELVANALVHQDFMASGSGPIIEIFEDRLEITNPGHPLVSTPRFLDSPPRSRNEALASFMRRVGVCEERGSGVDKVVHETEVFQLPPPVWETPEGGLRATLFAYKVLRAMDKAERTHACYLHACLRYVIRDPMTNSSLRERFGIAAHNSAMASRIIRDALEVKQIKPYDPEQSKKNARYLPW